MGMTKELEFWDSFSPSPRWLKTFRMPMGEVLELLPYEVELKIENSTCYTTSLDWCRDNVKHWWSVARSSSPTHRSMFFQNRDDALNYKLTWGGKV